MIRRLTLLAGLALLSSALLLTGCGKTAAPTNTSTAATAATTGSTSATASTATGATATTGASAVTGTDADGDGVPDSAEALLGTDPKNADTDGDGLGDKTDPAPLALGNPIKESSAKVGFKINSIVVENNVDAGGAAAPDHLELTVTNTAGADIGSGFELYYTLTDTVTGTVQSFYLPLPGFALKTGETVHLHVDDATAAGHFRADPNSMFYTGKNAVKVEATLHTPSFAPQTTGIQKDAAGAEAGGD